MTQQELRDALGAYFPPEEVDWKPQAVKGDRALAVAYIDARVVMDRLDNVMGPGGWSDAYESLGDGVVRCTLKLKIDGEWVPKSDVGGESDQPDKGDRQKAGHSDALKRAAVKWNVGRYLYSLPHQWCDFDPQKKQFKSRPKLPDWALPRKQTASQPQPQQQTAESPRKPAAPAEPIEERLKKAEVYFAKEGLCQPGDLNWWLVGKFGGRFGNKIADWPAEAADVIKEALTDFQMEMRKPGRYITQGERQKLERTIRQKNETLSRVMKGLGKPPKHPVEELTATEWKEAMRQLSEMPDLQEAAP